MDNEINPALLELSLTSQGSIRYDTKPNSINGTTAINGVVIFEILRTSLVAIPLGKMIAIH
jgi:hypothetical protein